MKVSAAKLPFQKFFLGPEISFCFCDSTAFQKIGIDYNIKQELRALNHPKPQTSLKRLMNLKANHIKLSASSVGASPMITFISKMLKKCLRNSAVSQSHPQQLVAPNLQRPLKLLTQLSQGYQISLNNSTTLQVYCLPSRSNHETKLTSKLLCVSHPAPELNGPLPVPSS